MSLTEQHVSKILTVLAHPLRRQIILYLREKGTCSFTDLANTTGVDTGKLSFHLRTLADFLKQTPDGKYMLSAKGLDAIVLIKDLEDWALESDLDDKSLSQSTKPSKRVSASLIDFILVQAILILVFQLSFLPMNLLVFVIFFWAYLTLFEGFAGQSLGKLIFHIKIVQITGEKISYGQAAIRNFGKVFLLPVDLILGIRLKDKRYLRYFEKFTKTTVIELPRKQKDINKTVN